MMKNKEYFSSRWTLLATVLGMAIGTGNIWRFPRIVAQNGGGAFLIPWLIFLLTWSIPLLIVEFSLGKHTRMGVIGAFGQFMGKKFVWMGAFVGFVTIAIMFYYSVVTGWCIRYFLMSVAGGLNLMEHQTAVDLFERISSSESALGFHILSMAITATIVYRGITRGIEKANRILIPALFLILLISALRAVTLPGGIAGLEFLFHPRWSELLDYKVWLEALSQSAWSTGAGWGLILTYAIYLREKDDIVLNSMLTGFGNNAASLLSGIVIFSAVFALSPAGISPNEILQSSGRASTGLTFEWIPVLFASMPGRVFLEPLFFLALSFAAISSLISMIELSARIFIDFGWTRQKAVVFVAVAGSLAGIPSSLSIGFFNNQDWVWGLGLMLSGLFFAIAVIRFSVNRFRTEIVLSTEGDFPLGKWFNLTVKFLIPVQFTALIIWWFARSVSWNPQWWNPLATYTIGTCLFQWTAIAVVFILLSNKMMNRIGLE